MRCFAFLWEQQWDERRSGVCWEKRTTSPLVWKNVSRAHSSNTERRVPPELVEMQRCRGRKWVWYDHHKESQQQKEKIKKTQVWDAGKVRSEDLFLQIDSSLHSRVKFVGKHPHQRFPPSSYQGSAKFNSPISLHDWQQDRALTHTKRKKREREKKKDRPWNEAADGRSLG